MFGLGWLLSVIVIIWFLEDKWKDVRRLWVDEDVAALEEKLERIKKIAEANPKDKAILEVINK